LNSEWKTAFPVQNQSLSHRRVFVSGQRRFITPTIRRELRRRSAIEPVLAFLCR